MQTPVRPAAINTRQVTLEMLTLAGHAIAVGVVVSVAAALLIVRFVTLTL